LADARRFEDAELEKALRAYSKALEFNPASRDVRALIELGELPKRPLVDKGRPGDPELLAAKAVALARGEEEAIALSDATSNRRGVRLAWGDVLLARREKRASTAWSTALAQGDWVISCSRRGCWFITTSSPWPRSCPGAAGGQWWLGCGRNSARGWELGLSRG
jgi:hypothetical protein